MIILHFHIQPQFKNELFHILHITHLEMLMQLPKMNNSSDLKQLQQLLDKTEAAIRSLQGIVVPVIIAKIPQELRLILSHGMTNRT